MGSYTRDPGSVFFFHFFHIENLAKFNPKKSSKISRIYTRKIKIPKFSQSICRKIAKFRQKKKRWIILVAAVASLTRQISTSLATVLCRTIKCVACRQACLLWRHSSQKHLKPNEIWRLVFKKQGLFARNLDQSRLLVATFRPKKKRKEKIDVQIDVTFHFQIQILLEEYLSDR